MGDLLGNQDFLRLLLMAAFAGYLFMKIHVATEKLWEGQIASTEVFKDSDEVTFPSITFCPGYLKTESLQPLENMTFEINQLSNLDDMFNFARQTININK